MKQKTYIFLILAFSSFFFSQAKTDGLNIPQLFTTHNSSVYIPCNVDTGNDHEYMTPIFWTRVGYDGSVHKILAPGESLFVKPSNVESHPVRLKSFCSLLVRNIVRALSGTYTCHTDKGNASTLVHVLDGEIPPVISSVESQISPQPSCSENFDLVHGKCLYYGNRKLKWYGAHLDCADKTSSLITFKDVKDLISFLLNLQKSGPTHYEYTMWVGYAVIDESKSIFGALQNDAQVTPLLHKGWATLSSCGRLFTVKNALIVPTTGAHCESERLNKLPLRTANSLTRHFILGNILRDRNGMLYLRMIIFIQK